MATRTSDGAARVCVTNAKGGTGKTTVAINVAGALNRRGHDVLFVDLDPQGNATEGLGLTAAYDAAPPTLFDVLTDPDHRDRLADVGAVQALDGVGEHGATIYADDGCPHSGVVDLEGSDSMIANEDVQGSYTWALAIRDPAALVRHSDGGDQTASTSSTLRRCRSRASTTGSTTSTHSGAGIECATSNRSATTSRTR